jgi:hypothetical protein
MAIGFAVAQRNARLDSIASYAGSAARLRIYSGTKPATGGAVTTLLAEFTLGSPLAPAASNGVLALTLPANTTGLAAGTATWARIVRADGTTHVADMDVGSSGTDVVLNTTTISVGVSLSIASATITEGNA